MSKPLISVIVPVYKAEPYLERCVNSIRNQTYTNLEIILVDDGSPDRCGEMCDAFALEDPRIRVFHKENGGQSSARNLALDHMTGEYVGFVDSDDWIEPEMYDILYDLMIQNNAQITACGLQCDFSDGAVRYFNPDYPSNTAVEIFEHPEALREVAIAEKITNSPCDKLFLKNIFDNQRMTVGMVNEDAEIMPRWLNKAQRVVYLPRPYYHYIMTASSTTRGVFKESRFTEADVNRQRIAYYKEHYPQFYPYVLASHIGICLMLIYDSTNISSVSSQRTQLIRELKKIRSREVFHLLRRNAKIKWIAFRIATPLYVAMMRCFGKNR